MVNSSGSDRLAGLPEDGPDVQVVEIQSADTHVQVALFEAPSAGPAGPPPDGADRDDAGAPADAAPDGTATREGAAPSWWPAWPPSWPAVRLAALVAVVVLAVVVSAVLAFERRAPTIDELRRRAGWTDLQTLKVGVSGDVPGVSECLPGKGCTGFDVEVAELMADWLGVPRANVEFYEVLPENRFRMVGTRAGTTTTVRLDLVVAGFSITEERVTKDHVVFAGPYLVTENSVLTRRDHEVVESLPALDHPVRGPGGAARRQRVCTPGTSTSADYLRADVREAEIVLRQRNSDCVRLLRAGQVDAAVTDAALLAGFQARYPKELRLNNVASTVDENWGIGLGRDPTGHDERLQARRQLLLLALDDLRTAPGQRSWGDAFRLLPPTVAEPGQEAQVVAIDVQPVPSGLQPVRRWPWERTGTGTAAGVGTSS